ncbi:D-2-hydroxyacid dehydrogenase family protein [Rhizobium sp. Root1204]|uniref:D-2-hydroxyacid dehydrogenase family protein n=1 Tax=Rhizobium sp. Root1204 TaxID=1736428 RepID=UPI0007154514|nr:D-2-hydroxyacid dehydrogenase family protein [Rhizobium sp. Root1204]KQV36982.1 hydroxyacid dehydrogenase [Rhizobium sp. Root1204]
MTSNQAVKKIAILDDYQGVALEMADWSVLDGRAEITVFRDNLVEPHALIERLKDFDIVCVMRERAPMTRQVLEALPKLKLLASNSSKNASIDMQAASELGITVSGTEYLSYGTTEMAWGLILSGIRRIPQEIAAVRSGKWQHTVGQDIHGRTLGILGLGNFGKAVAKVGAAFGMHVIAWSQNLDPAHAAEHGVEAVSKNELFERSDVISIHMVLSDRSRGIVGKAELERMKPNAWLINTSRGPLVDEAALAEVLQAGKIGGAGLDTYSQEPLPEDHPFRTLPNVLAMPHLGYVTEDTYRLFYGQTVENIIAWLDGNPVRLSNPTGARP